MRSVEERLDLLDEMLTNAAEQGLLQAQPDDLALNGRTISLHGRPVLNFGSCSYLGLELHPQMLAGVIDAVTRYGTQFSASRAYMSAPLYPALEASLQRVFGGHVLVVSSTTLGHIAALPVLICSRDAVVMDQQVHHSVQSAVNQLRPQGTTIEMIRHNRLDQLEEQIADLSRRHRHVWYLADGVYSMFADLAPFDELRELLARCEQLHLYIDDSHGVGWRGQHGRGPALEAMGSHDRVVVAASLNKSFAAAGAALIFPTAELKRRVRTLGGPMIFSGPVQPPMLGAALASAAIHLSPELDQLQSELRMRIAGATELLKEHGLPLACDAPTPIRYVTLGLPRVAEAVTKRLLDDGFYVNLAIFPAVPMKQAGVRFTLTVHQSPSDVTALVEALARHVPELLAHRQAPRLANLSPSGTAEPAEARSKPQEGTHCDQALLTLETHRSVDSLSPAEWNALLGDRGSFTVDGLRTLERTFTDGHRREDAWSFRYYVVRDGSGAPVLATFFTAGLWKDDMLSTAEVSRQVEARRQRDPYYLTSVTFAMGSLITEGDHLYLDRSADWRGALSLLIEAVGRDAASLSAASVVMRDLPAEDRDLIDFLKNEGYARITMPDSLIIKPIHADDEAWLGGLSGRSRAHQRHQVLPWDSTFDVEIIRRDTRAVSDDELEQLHALYRNVRASGLEINSFELPRHLLREMLQQDCWELMLMRLREHPGRDPVAFGAHFVGGRHYAPMIVGLDYDYVQSHHSYRQALRQAMLRARFLGAESMMLGMGAPLEKRRFGAVPVQRCALVQAADHYNLEVLSVVFAEA